MSKEKRRGQEERRANCCGNDAKKTNGKKDR